MDPFRLTIGMATYRDFDGVYFTLNALRLYHARVLDRCELLVVDNDPNGPQAARLRDFLDKVRQGAAAPERLRERTARELPQPYSVQYVPLNEPERYPIRPPTRAPRPSTNGHGRVLEELFQRAASTRSDINEHCPKLRELSGQCETVVEFGHRPEVSTVALLAGQPRRFITFAPTPPGNLSLLQEHCGGTEFEFHPGDWLSVTIPSCDLLFIDTKHNASQLWAEFQRHTVAVSRYIVLHDTQIYGVRGDDGQDGGDGNLTQQTQYVNATETRVTAFAYDWRNRQTDIDGEIDFYQKTSYDNLDQTIKTERYDTTASGHLVARNETLYDDRGRVYRTIRWGVNPATGTVGNSLADNTWYDEAGNVIQRQPAGLMNGLELEYDSLSRLVKRTDPLGAETVFAYDAASNRVSLTDAENNTTTWGYDGVGRVVKETNPLGDARRFAYDDAGMLSVRTDRLGRVVEFDYDDVGRPTAERWKTGGSTVNTLTFTYDPDGRVATAGDDHSRYAYQYDLNGGMTEVDNDGTPGVPRVVLTAEYNRIVERTTLAATVASTNDFLNSYGYDALGRPSSIAQDTHGGTSVAPKRVDFAYEVRGGYSTIDRYADLTGSSLVAKSAYGYDDFARLTSIEHAKGTTSLASHDYTFNAARLIDQHATVDGDSDYSYDDDAQLTAALHSFQADESYSYDLTGERRSGANGYRTSFVYDPSGNRLVEISDGDRTTSVYDGVNRLLQANSLSGITTYSYDAAGNRRSMETPSGDRTTYTWNGENQLTQVELPTGDVVTYVWDPVNKLSEERVVTRDDGVNPVTYLWDNNNVIRETDDVGTVEAEYTYQPEPYGDLVSQTRDAESSFYWFDALGSTTTLTDQLGTVTDEARYQAFGHEIETTGSTEAPYRWVGKLGYRLDETTGLFNLRARDYDAELGRFLSQDPIELASGDSNFYRYAVNNPVAAADPSGKGPEWHHLLPPQVFSEYSSYIAGLNINIHDAQWGWILPDTAHAQLHPAWNNEWSNWFRSKIGRGEAITLQSIRAKLASMLRDPRYARYLNQGVPANVSYFDWVNKVKDKVKHFNKLKKTLAILLAVLAGCVAGAADAYAAFGPALELGSEEARREYATALEALQSGDYDTATKAMFGTEETCPFYEPNPKGLVCKLLAKTFQAQKLSYNAVIRADAAARRKWSDAINKARQNTTSSCPTCPTY